MSRVFWSWSGFWFGSDLTFSRTWEHTFELIAAHVPACPRTTRVSARVDRDSSQACSMSTSRRFERTALRDSTEDSCPACWVFVCIVDSSKSPFLLLLPVFVAAFFLNAMANEIGCFSFGGYDTIRDTVLIGPLQGNFLASFAVGWVCTTVRSVFVARPCFYLDLIQRHTGCSLGRLPPRHHPSSYDDDFRRSRKKLSRISPLGSVLLIVVDLFAFLQVKYKSFIDAGRQIVLKEGYKSLFGMHFSCASVF